MLESKFQQTHSLSSVPVVEVKCESQEHKPSISGPKLKELRLCSPLRTLAYQPTAIPLVHRQMWKIIQPVLEMICVQCIESLSWCWLPRPGLLLQIRNYPNFSWCWVGTGQPCHVSNPRPLCARQRLCHCATAMDIKKLKAEKLWTS